MNDEIKIEVLWNACRTDEERRVVVREHELRECRDRAVAAYRKMLWPAEAQSVHQAAVKAKTVRMPRKREEAILGLMNGHPVPSEMLRGEMPSATFLRTMRRLVAKRLVRKVKHGYYERVVTA
jgi:hypothetical protein